MPPPAQIGFKLPENTKRILAEDQGPRQRPQPSAHLTTAEIERLRRQKDEALFLEDEDARRKFREAGEHSDEQWRDEIEKWRRRHAEEEQTLEREETVLRSQVSFANSDLSLENFRRHSMDMTNPKSKQIIEASRRSSQQYTSQQVNPELERLRLEKDELMNLEEEEEEARWRNKRREQDQEVESMMSVTLMSRPSQTTLQRSTNAIPSSKATAPPKVVAPPVPDSPPFPPVVPIPVVEPSSLALAVSFHPSTGSQSIVKEKSSLAPQPLGTTVVRMSSTVQPNILEHSSSSSNKLTNQQIEDFDVMAKRDQEILLKNLRKQQEEQQKRLTDLEQREKLRREKSENKKFEDFERIKRLEEEVNERVLQSLEDRDRKHREELEKELKLFQKEREVILESSMRPIVIPKSRSHDDLSGEISPVTALNRPSAPEESPPKIRFRTEMSAELKRRNLQNTMQGGHISDVERSRLLEAAEEGRAKLAVVTEGGILAPSEVEIMNRGLDFEEGERKFEDLVKLVSSNHVRVNLARFNQQQSSVHFEITYSYARLTLLRKIHFVAGQVFPEKSSKQVIKDVAEGILTFYKACRYLMVRPFLYYVDGHANCHEQPNNPIIWNLSEARALAIIDELVQYGVKREYLHPRWFGGTRPLTSAEDSRRVEVMVYQGIPWHVPAAPLIPDFQKRKSFFFSRTSPHVEFPLA